MDSQISKIVGFLKGANAPADIIELTEKLIPVSKTTVEEYLKTDEGKQVILPLVDAASSKAVNTYKEKTLPGLVEDEIAKRYPPETEDKKALRTLQEKQTAMERELNRKDLLTKAQKIAIEKKLPINLVERFLGDDEAATIENLKTLESEFNSGLDAAVKDKFKEGGRDPGNTNPNPPPDLSKLTDEEYFALQRKK